MLDLSRCKFINSTEKQVATGSTVTQEGQALMAYMENGEELVKVSAGAASERFVGFSFSNNFNILTRTFVETVTVPAESTYVVSLTKNNLVATQIAIYDNTAGAALAEDTVADGKFAVVDATGVVTFHSAQASHVCTVTYKYTPTALEIAQEFGNANVNMGAAALFNKIGVIEAPATVYTDQFDASVNWTGASTVYLGANGILAGAGNVSLTARVIHVPSADLPFLGISFK